jgi:hypothetical protein
MKTSTFCLRIILPDATTACFIAPLMTFVYLKKDASIFEEEDPSERIKQVKTLLSNSWNKPYGKERNLLKDHYQWKGFPLEKIKITHEAV